MTSSVRRYKILILLFTLFLVGEYLRIIGNWDIERTADNLFFCSIAIVWAVYIKRRIIEDNTRRVLIGLALSLILLFVVRTCKYVLFDKNTILWYMYYLPLTSMPLLVYLMSRSGGYGEKSNKPIKYKWYILGLVLLNAMILTNDLHQLVFRFKYPGDVDHYNYGVGYVITMAWIGVFAFLALYNLYRTCRLPQSRKNIWLPLLPLALGIIAIVIDVFGLVPEVYNTRLYLFQEVVLLVVILIVEACIKIGIIPSNDDYEEIFANSKVNSCITNQANEVVYSSDEDNIISTEKRLEVQGSKVMLDDYTRLHFNPIRGGVVYYTEDIKEIVKLNNMLEEAAEVISDENAMIEAENKLLRDEAMYRTKNKLYDDIARIVRPQVIMIEECLERCEKEPETFSANISKAAVLNAYIKRRINLSLLAIDNEKLSAEELYLAIMESLNYLKYCNVTTSVLNALKDARVNSKQCIVLYDCFEAIVEAYYGNVSALMVTLSEREHKKAIRITLETVMGGKLLPEIACAHEVYEEEDMVSITLSLTEGGEADE